MPRRRKDLQDMNFHMDDMSPREKPQQRNAANARERARMRVLSKAFCRLKTTLPWVPPDTKLSKLDTLRLATSYIGHLRTILTDEEDGANGGGSVHPLNLSWPFSFQRSASSWTGTDHQADSPLSDGSEDIPDSPPSLEDQQYIHPTPPSHTVHHQGYLENSYSDSLMFLG